MTLLSDTIDKYVDSIVKRERAMNPHFDIQAGFRGLVSVMNWCEWYSRHPVEEVA